MHCVWVCVYQYNCSSCGWLTGQQTAKCVCLRVCVGLFLSSHLLIFISTPKVSPVILAICLLSCHTCLLSFQRSGRQTDRERTRGREKMGTRADYSWLAALCVPWIAYECRGNTASLTVWQNERSNAWNDGWVDGCMLQGLFIGCHLILAHILLRLYGFYWNFCILDSKFITKQQSWEMTLSNVFYQQSKGKLVIPLQASIKN